MLDRENKFGPATASDELLRKEDSELPDLYSRKFTHGHTDLNNETLVAKAEQHLAKIDSSYVYYAPDAPIMVRGENTHVYDVNGREYFDLVSGFSALNQGHCHPAIVRTLTEQSSRLTHTSQTLSESKILLAEKLANISPIPKALVHFDLGGSRAVEMTLLLVKAFTGKTKFVAFQNSFHGRSMGALSIHDLDTNANFVQVPANHYKANYPYCFRCPLSKEPSSCHLECASDLEEICSKYDDIGAVIVEPALGARGYIFPPLRFLKHVREVCDRYNLLMIDDEVQMALGRTGTMFSCSDSEVVPDIIVLSKSICGGFWPLAAVIGRRDIMQSVPPGTFGNTFAGNPLACAVALTSIEVIEREGLCENSRRVGEYFRAELLKLAREFRFLGSVEGRGLGIGVEIVTADGRSPDAVRTQAIVRGGLKHGLLLQRGGKYKNRLTLIPPLTLTEREVDEICRRLRHVFTDTINAV